MQEKIDFAKSAKINLGDSLNEESLKPLPMEVKTELIVRAVKHLCQNEDDYTITPMSDFNVLNIKFENEDSNEYSKFIKSFNDFLLNKQSEIIEDVTGESAKKFYRNFIFYESVYNHGVLTLTWK